MYGTRGSWYSLLAVARALDQLSSLAVPSITRAFPMSQATLDAYVCYPGNCCEAMAFYRAIFGGEVSYMDMEGQPGKVMHAHLKGGIVNLMGSDGAGTRTNPYGQGAITLSVTGNNNQELRTAFDALFEAWKLDESIAAQPRGDYWAD